MADTVLSDWDKKLLEDAIARLSRLERSTLGDRNLVAQAKARILEVLSGFKSRGGK